MSTFAPPASRPPSSRPPTPSSPPPSSGPDSGRRGAAPRRLRPAARWLAAPAIAAVFAAGVWVAGGVLADSFRVSTALVAVWFVLSAAGTTALARRERPLALPLGVGYVLAAGAIGIFLGLTTVRDKVVDEQVIVAPPASALAADGTLPPSVSVDDAGSALSPGSGGAGGANSDGGAAGASAGAGGAASDGGAAGASAGAADSSGGDANDGGAAGARDAGAGTGAAGPAVSPDGATEGDPSTITGAPATTGAVTGDAAPAAGRDPAPVAGRDGSGRTGRPAARPSTPAAAPPARPRRVPKAIAVTERTGTFVSGEHATSGTASLVKRADGRRVLTLTGFSTSAGPDLRVRLAPSGSDRGDGDGAIDLGGLKGNRGDQQYTLPEGSGAEGPLTVVIWCRAFTATFGSARLHAA